MLIPIVGRAGCGKTQFVLSKIEEAAKAGKKVLLIVPEQFSFEMEKEVFSRLNDASAMNVDVYSFTRLCHRVFTECGGAAGEYVTDAAKQILMELAVDQVRDALELYSRQAKNISFVSTMLRQVDEFKNAGVNPERLMAFSQSGVSARLSRKTGEMALIYQYYQALLTNRFQDEKDSIMKCCALLEGKNYFQDTTIFIDSFMTFMAGEKKLILQMLGECQDLYLTFPGSGLSVQAEEDGMIPDSTFDTARETLMGFIRDAKQQGISVAAPVVLKESFRFENDALRHMERFFPCIQQKEFAGENSAVKLLRAHNPYEEIRYVAAQIIRLVRREGMSYREIAVIARDIDRYRTSIEDLFQQYEIPFFFDMREDVRSIPVFSLIFSAIDSLKSRFSTEFVLGLAKNPLMGISDVEAAQLENYCFLWNIDHKLWLSEDGFVNNPQGLKESFSDEDRELLKQISNTAQTVMQPLLRFQEKLQDCDGQGFSTAIYEFLLETGARDRLVETSSRTDLDAEEMRTLHLNQGAWDILMDLLDVFATVLEGIPLPYERMGELFYSASLASDIGSIPNTLDQVALGSADRMRPNKPKVTFVIGLNQGEFPPQLSENGLFSESERDTMKDKGIELNPSVIKLDSYEKYYLYAALTSPSQQLILTNHMASLAGDLCPDSPAVGAMERIFGDFGQDMQDLPEDFYIANDRTAFQTLCRNLREDSPFTASLMEYVRGTAYAARLDTILSMMQAGDFRIQDREISRMLFGSNIRLSPSRIDKYFTCPFSYFCSAGLGLNPRKKVEISPMQSGTIIHYVLEKVISRHGGKGLGTLTEEEIGQEVRDTLQEFLKDRVSRTEALSKRFHYLFERLSITLTRLIGHLAEEFAQSDFEPVEFEMPIGRHGKVPAVEMKLEDGTSVRVEGIIDRVDMMEKDGKKYVRVVDYKSGSKVFRLDDVYYGLNLQMLIYLFSIEKNGRGKFSGCMPGGVLYFPAKDHIINASRETTDAQIELEHQKKYKMNGLVLNDPVCVEGMEHQVAGAYIPVREKKGGGFDAHSSLADLEQMGKIQRHIECILMKMARYLHEGKIEAVPSVGLGYEPCKYCDYKDICLRQQEDPGRKLKELGKQGFFKALDEEEKQEQEKGEEQLDSSTKGN